MNHTHPCHCPIIPIICSNNTMIIIKSSVIKWGNLMNMEVSRVNKYLLNTWDLVLAPEWTLPALCKRPAKFIESSSPNNQPRRNKKSWKKFTTHTPQQIVLYCLSLCTPNPWNPVLREVVTRLTYWDKEERTQQKISCVCNTAWNHKQ